MTKDLEQTKDMRVLREAPSFTLLAKATKSGSWRLPLRDYSLDGVLSIEGHLEKLGHAFVLAIDGEGQLIPLTEFTRYVERIMNGERWLYEKASISRIPASENLQAHENAICTLTIGKKQALIDMEELLSYTRLV